MRGERVADEVELKFDPFGDVDEETLAVLRPALDCYGITIGLLAPRGVLDIYLDTLDGALLGAGCVLRVRATNAKPSFAVNFKLPGRADGDVVVRREHRIDLDLGELLAWIDDGKPACPTLDEPAGTLRSLGHEPNALAPMVWVESYRRLYFVRAKDDPTSEAPLATIVLEDVVAMPATGVDRTELLTHRVLPFDSPGPEARFPCGEVEVVGQYFGRPEALDMLERVAATVADLPGYRRDVTSKYARTVGMLGLLPGVIAPPPEDAPGAARHGMAPCGSTP